MDKNKQKTEVDIAAKILHYSPFSITHKREENYFFKRQYNGFTLITRADETINQQDNDVFKSLIKLMQIANQNNAIRKQTIEAKDKAGKVIDSWTTAAAIFYLSDIVNLSKSKWTFVLESLERIQSVRITYKNKTYSVHSSLFPRIIINKEDGTVIAYFDYDVFKNCINKKHALTQDLDAFTSLRGNVAKALYDYMTANSNRLEFKEKTLITRLGLEHMPRFTTRKWLKEAWREIAEIHKIKNFKIYKRNREYYHAYEPH